MVVWPAAQHMAGFVFHRDAVGRMAEVDAGLRGGAAGEKLVQHLFVAGKDEADVGMTLGHALQSGDDNARPGIATHRIHRNDQFAGQRQPSSVRE